MSTTLMSEHNVAEKPNLNWITISFMLIFHLGAVAALFMFSWKALFVTLVLWWVSGSL